MTREERLGKLTTWWFANAADVLAGCEAGNRYALDFNRTMFAVLAIPTAAHLEAAEIALVELEADWEGK